MKNEKLNATLEISLASIQACLLRNMHDLVTKVRISPNKVEDHEEIMNKYIEAGRKFSLMQVK